MSIGIKVLSAIGNIGLSNGKKSKKAARKGKTVKAEKKEWVSKHLGFVGAPVQSDFDNPTEGLYSAALEVKANEDEIITGVAKCKTRKEKQAYLKENKDKLFMSFSLKKFGPAVVERNATGDGMDHLHFVRQWVSCQTKAEFRALRAVIEAVADTVLESHMPEDHTEVAVQEKKEKKAVGTKTKRVKS